MGADSKIEWTHHTFNPWRGCTKVSPGCTNCYAETLSHRNPKTLGIWGDKGTRVVAAESYWHQPGKWDRAARAAGERHRVFCASLADVFEDRPELVTPRGRLFHLINETPNLDWLLLTKRPENIVRLSKAIPGSWSLATPPNVWIGTSVENQKAADERIPELLKVPASVRFLSMEPLLGPVDLSRFVDFYWTGTGWSRTSSYKTHRLHWVIVGGESGSNARPMHPAWVRSIRDQCRSAGVAFHYKQWGEWAPIDYETPRGARLGFVQPDGHISMAISGYEPGCPCDHNPREEPMVRVGKKAAGRLLDGRTWDELPLLATTEARP